MRLSQLARKLEISPSELILFFKKNEIKRYNSHNNKVEEGDVKLVFNHFSHLEAQSENEGQDLATQESPMDILSSSPGSDTKMPVKEAPEPESVVDKEEIELISMPKIKLEGVKVVGKIDLPEPEKKVKDEVKSDTGDQGKLSDGSSHAGRRSEKRNSKKRTIGRKGKKNQAQSELSYEEKLKREERKKIQEQQRLKRLEKREKKQRYIKNVQSNITPTRKKKKTGKNVERDLEQIKVRPEYKNPVRKFWAWLNGEYD